MDPIGVYQPLGQLGRGGTGVVLRARAPDGSEVAIKVLFRSKDRADALPRFLRELRLQRQLGVDDGFVPVLDSGETPAGPYVVMPLVEGGTLRERLRRGPLAIAEAIELARSLALALGRAHASGIVHRDVKPENVLFTKDGRPLIADLGLAKHFRRDAPGGSESASLSKTGEFRGTLGYMPVEQLRDAARAGPPADVFALGAILYECLAGTGPFPGESVMEIVGKVEAGEIEPLPSARRDVPAWLERVVARSLSRNAEDRFADGAAFAAALVAPPARSRADAVAANGVVAVAAFFAVARGDRRGEPAATAPIATPTAVAREPSISPWLGDSCRAFLRTPHTRLLAAWGDTRFAHEAAVHCVATSPDAALLTAGEDGLIHVWTPRDGKWIDRFVYSGHQGGVRGLCCVKAPVSAGRDGTVRIWSARGSTNLRGHEGPVNAVAREGDLILSGGDDRTLRLWDVAKREELAVLRGHDGPITAVALIDSATRAVSTSMDGTLRTWDLSRRAVEDVVVRHPGPIFGLTVSGRTLACGGESARVEIVDLATRRPTRTIEHANDAVASLALSPDGRTVATGTIGGELRLYEVESGRLVGVKHPHSWRISSIVFLHDGRRVLTGSHDGTARITRLDADEPELDPLGPHRGGVNQVAFGAGLAVTAGHDRSLRAWDVAPVASPSFVVQGDMMQVYAVALSADGRRAFSGGSDHAPRLWDLSRGALIRELPQRASTLEATAVSENAARGAVGGRDGFIHVYDLGQLDEKPVELAGHRGRVDSLAFEPDGERLWSAASDETLRCWDSTTGEQTRLLAGPRGEVSVLSSIKISTRELVPAGEIEDRAPNLLSGMAEIPIAGRWFERRRARAALAPRAGRALASTLVQPVVRVWDLGAGKIARTLPEAETTALAISPDGALGLVATARRTLRVFDLDSGRAIDELDLAGAADRVDALAFAPDGKRFLAGTARGQLWLFALEP